MGRLNFLVGSWQCTNTFTTNGLPSRKQRNSSSTMVIAAKGGHWLQGTVTASSEGQSLGTSDLFVGYNAGHRQWVMIVIDPLGYSVVETSESVALNGSKWEMAYPKRTGFTATLQTDSSAVYTFDSFWESHKGNAISSHQSCSKR
ncbi:MAG TPA: DUF1579 family protein [Candidatus Cybelea sp.]